MNPLQIFEILLVYPITNLLVFFYKVLFLMGVPYALGFAIILLTVFIRILLSPFVSAQLKAAEKMQRIAPHMSNIREKHKEDKKRQQEELMRLYKEHGVNPAAGCLPAIIQLPIIWSLYSVLTNTVAAKSAEAIEKINSILYPFPFLKIEKVWETSFFGLPLYQHPSEMMAQNPLIILIPVVTGLLQFILSKMMMPASPPPISKKKQDDFQTAFQTQSQYIFPVMIGFFSYTLPIGLSLYWNTFTIFGILQQYLLIGPGGTKPWLDKIAVIWKRR